MGQPSAKQASRSGRWWSYDTSKSALIALVALKKTGVLDLNAVDPFSSPCASAGYGHEHLSGPQYQQYLRGVVEQGGLRVEAGVEVVGKLPCNTYATAWWLKCPELYYFKLNGHVIAWDRKRSD